MERCPHCQVELLFEGSEFCEHCNGVLPKKLSHLSSDGAAEDEGSFVVTEAASEKTEFVGGYLPTDDPEHLGSQSQVELMLSQTEAGSDIETPVADGNAAVPPGHTPASTSGSHDNAKSGLRRLSNEELKSVEKGLYSSSSYLTEEERLNLVKHMSALESMPKKDPAPAKPSNPAQSGEVSEAREIKSGVSRRGRNVAYFLKNFILLKGDLTLHDQDELSINGHEYLLKKKQLSAKTVIGLAAGASMIVLVVVGSLLVSSPGSGSGTIVGVVLDNELHPYLQGATVQLPDLGRTYSTNAQGFFRTDPLPVGSHKIEYVIGGTKASVDYATVAAGEVTTISLKPSPEQNAMYHSNREIAIQPTASKLATPPEPRTPVAEGGTDVTAATAGAKSYAKLTLAANVGGVRLTLDGTPIGAGNTTYSKIKPGSHEYSLSKDGFETVAGTIELVGGQSARLEATLNPIPVETAPALAQEEVRLNEGTAAMNGGDVKAAIEKFSEAITINPNFVPAYQARAEAAEGRGDKVMAHDDYIRVAEICRGRSENDKALTAYNKAITVDAKSLPGFLGRASLYLDKNEEIAATQDFEMVLKLDKKNLQANTGLGEVRFNQGNFKKAIKFFKDARDLDPNNPQIYEYLMLCYLSDDDLKNVRKSYEKFKEVASQEEQKRLTTDGKFNAVLRIVETE